MDIFLFILIGLAILLLVAATSRVGHNLGRINCQLEGRNEGETLRWLRESQQYDRLKKEGLATPKLEQVEPVWPVADPLQRIVGKAD